jgi:predicted O-methyltransferase YrrM
MNIKEYAIKNNVPIIEDDSLEYIIKYIKDNNYLSILEIGTAIGYSSINIALSNNNIYITTIEKDINMYNLAVKNILDMKLDNRIKVINGDALDVEIDDKYDLIFIDAAKAQYTKFFNKYSINLNDNGTIITDNLKFHGLVDDYKNITSKDLRELVGKIIRYINFLKENKEYNTKFIDIGDGISLSKKVENNEDSSLSS